MAEITGFRIFHMVTCDFCRQRNHKGGYIVKDGPAPGQYCSAFHAQEAANEAEQNEKTK